MRLQDQVAIITGAGRGIGRAIATRFAREGARVVVDDIDEKTGSAVVTEIDQAGGTAHFIEADVAVEDDVKRMMAQTLERFGALDIVVNNAIPGVEEVDCDDFDALVRVCLRGTWLCCKEAISLMKQRGGGCIVNMSSVNALIGIQNNHIYSAVKGAIVSLTRSLAVAYGRDGIRLNALCPGGVTTDQWQLPLKENPEILDDMARHYALGRLAAPEDVASAALYLASDESSYMTGSVQVIDGGLTAGLPRFGE